MNHLLASSSACAAIHSRTPFPSSSRYSEETLRSCRELQQDELLALEAIYEQKFSHLVDERGRLVFRVSVDIDFGAERDITVVEEPIAPPPSDISPQSIPQKQQRPHHARPASREGHMWRNETLHEGATGRTNGVKPSRGRAKGKGRVQNSGIDARATPFHPRGGEHSLTVAKHDIPPLPVPTSSGKFDIRAVQAALPSLTHGHHPSSSIDKGEAHANLALPPRKETKIQLRYLLPIELVAVLEHAYPLEEAPRIDLRCPWLSPELKQAALDSIAPLWQKDVSTFLMVDELSSLVSAGLLPDPLPIHDRYIYTPPPPALSNATAIATAISAPNPLLPARTTLLSQLTTHDRLVRHSAFTSESFGCGICLETKKGARCARLKACGHVFCVECLHGFWELNIREGLVGNVSCADWECVKARQKENKGKDTDKLVGSSAVGEVGDEEIEAIVGKESTDRYRWLVEKQRIESDPTVTYCPRESCNAPVPRELDEAYERLRVCPACQYTFCVYCRRTYHGTKSRCVFSQAGSIVDKYVNGSDDEKAALETRYGKNNVRKLVEAYLEEQANAKWIEENSTRCPDCQLDIERSMGCAHMTCSRCFCHFCFRCGCKLSAVDPYAHFSTPGSSCFNKLFDYQPSEEQMNEAMFQAMMA